MICALQAKRRYSITKRVDPGGGALWSPRELRMSNQHELEQTTTVPIRLRFAAALLSLATSPHRNTQHSLQPASTSGRHPTPCGLHLYLSQHARLTTTYMSRR